MARIRTLKPEIPQSESLSRVSRDARLTFMLLISQCDDYGRFIAHPRAVASALYPYDEDAANLISGWLAELEREDCIRRYAVNGNSYLFLPKWGEHQRIDNAGKGKYPPPTEDTTPAARGEPAQEPPTLAEVRGEIPRAAENGGGSPLDQGREGTKEGKGETRARGALRSPEGFDDPFWKAYPHKVGKPTARRAFENALKTAPLAEIMGGLERYIAGKPAERPWLNPASFLRAERYRDEPAPLAENGSAAPPMADADRWRVRVTHFRRTGEWPEYQGPKPGEIGCQVPDEMLTDAERFPVKPADETIDELAIPGFLKRSAA